ncbi:MAG: hypothetical protein ACXWT4_20710 [Methylobacter sp.]
MNSETRSQDGQITALFAKFYESAPWIFDVIGVWACRESALEI